MLFYPIVLSFRMTLSEVIKISDLSYNVYSIIHFIINQTSQPCPVTFQHIVNYTLLCIYIYIYTHTHTHNHTHEGCLNSSRNQILNNNLSHSIQCSLPGY